MATTNEDLLQALMAMGNLVVVHVGDARPATPCGIRTLCADDLIRPCVLPKGHTGWCQTADQRKAVR